MSFIELYWKLTKLQLKNCLKNRVDFYHTFCPGNHRDGNEYLSTQSISNFEKLHSLKKNTVNVFWQLFVLTAICFGTGAAPGVLCNVAVLCCVVAAASCWRCVVLQCWLLLTCHGLLPALDLSWTAACSWLVMDCCLLLTCHGLLPALDLFFVSGGCHMLPSYFLVLYVIANTQKHFFSPPWVSKWSKTFWHHDESAV